MKRWMFIFPLGAGVAGLAASVPNMSYQQGGMAYHWLLAGSYFPAVIGAGGLLGLIRLNRQVMELTPQAHADGFREVLSGKSLAERWKTNLLLLGSALVLDLALSISQFQIREPATGDRLIFIACLTLPVIVLGIVQLRLWLFSKDITQPRLFVEPFPISRGVPLRIRVEAQVKRPTDRLHLRVWLLCTETTVLYLRRQNLALRKNIVEYVVAEKEEKSLAAGASVGVNHQLTISAGTPASGSAAVDGYPHYQWQLHLELTGALKLLADFPLEIG
jgi:hypothetical protein